MGATRSRLRSFTPSQSTRLTPNRKCSWIVGTLNRVAILNRPTNGGPHLVTCGDFLMATDMMPRAPQAKYSSNTVQYIARDGSDHFKSAAHFTTPISSRQLDQLTTHSNTHPEIFAEPGGVADYAS